MATLRERKKILRMFGFWNDKQLDELMARLPEMFDRRISDEEREQHIWAWGSRAREEGPEPRGKAKKAKKNGDASRGPEASRGLGSRTTDSTRP